MQYGDSDEDLHHFWISFQIVQMKAVMNVRVHLFFNKFFSGGQIYRKFALGLFIDLGVMTLEPVHQIVGTDHDSV